MKDLHFDLETYSSVDITTCGAYKYVESPDFEILLMSYSMDDGPTIKVSLATGETIPDEILDAMTDTSITKWAHNASFERVCMSKYLGMPSGSYISPRSWKCTMTWALTLGLPGSLAGVGVVIGLEKKKMEEGKDLIKYFCTPCKPTKANGFRSRNRPEDAPDKWATFEAYNIRDVDVEKSIKDRLSCFPVSDEIWEQYWIDQEINDNGAALDMVLVKNAIEMDEIVKKELSDALTEITELDNPKSVSQMKSWLEGQGLHMDSLGKKFVAEELKTAPPIIAKVLTLRQQISKSSVSKYLAMDRSVCKDGRAHGMFQFYGANRTGRWAGRLVQMQNLPQNHLEDLESARELVRDGMYDAVDLLYGDVSDTLSQLIRTAFIADPNKNNKLLVADFSAIEARVIAWMAGEEWRSDVFANGGDIYCASASQMFGVPVVKHGVNGHLRQKGKVAELALGYGGGVGALKAMGALEMGLEEDELQPLVDAWRKASPKIVKLWWDVDRAVKTTVKLHTTTGTHGLVFTYERGFLFIRLPSGRRLAYVKPMIGTNKFGGESVTYEGTGENRRWVRLESYGPKFVENIIQGTARDVLCESMKRLHRYKIVMHIHDELVMDVDKSVDLDAVCKEMAITPEWAPGLLLRADGYETPFYMKD